MKPYIAIPATLALVYRAWSHKSLTTAGLVAAALTAAAHAYHPWSLPFALLCIFFLTGTRATKVKKDIKATLTIASKGSSGGEGPRNHIQVLANSLVASVLIVLHALQLDRRQKFLPRLDESPRGFCYPWGGDLLVVGVIAHYAAVTADTLSSELGILSKSPPRLITSFSFRQVPPGTNGGVTLTGTLAGALGSAIIAISSSLLLPMCQDGSSLGSYEGGGWTLQRRLIFAAAVTLWGTLGSLLDSILGGLLQRTVKDRRTGKIVEGEGGERVLILSESTHTPLSPIESAVLSGEGDHAVEHMDPTVSTSYKASADSPKRRFDPSTKHRRASFGDERPSRVVENGRDVLDNNQVNFLMALIMSLGAMVVAGYVWDIPLRTILPH